LRIFWNTPPKPKSSSEATIDELRVNAFENVFEHLTTGLSFVVKWIGNVSLLDHVSNPAHAIPYDFWKVGAT